MHCTVDLICRGTFGRRQDTGQTEKAILLVRTYRRSSQLVSNLFNLYSKEITCPKIQG